MITGIWHHAMLLVVSFLPQEKAVSGAEPFYFEFNFTPHDFCMCLFTLYGDKSDAAPMNAASRPRTFDALLALEPLIQHMSG